MAISIKKIVTPKYASINNKSTTFYRVSNSGVYVKDFRTKSEAQKFANKLRSN